MGFFELQDFSFTLHPGEVFGLLGPSGSGKSVLLNLMAGTLSPDSGSVRMFGSERFDRKQYGFVPQDPAFYNSLTVRENMRFYGSLYGIDAATVDRIGEGLLEFMGLKDRIDVVGAALSGGQRKRLNIILSMLHEPKLILLDEPTDQLDIVSRNHVWELIRDMKRHGFTVVFTTHLMNEAEHLCDKVALLNEGKLRACGPVKDLIQRVHPESIITVKSHPGKPETYESIMSKLKADGVDSVKIFEGRLSVFTHNPQDLEDKLIRAIESRGEQILEVRTKKPSLEDLFMAVVGRKGGDYDKIV